ncbi:MAG: hypothetical protein J0H96_01290 [Microbacterium ginsengisoli]|nr:hypothetical protein [Microbacterium ginsengisoli]
MRISLLIDSPLSVLAHALRGVGADVRKQISKYTKAEAQPIWIETTREQAQTRLQSRLAQSGRVGVSGPNITLRAGSVGRLSSGTPISVVTRGAEFGMGAEKRITTRSRKGTTYTRRAGNAFGPNRPRGNVAYPAARIAIPRLVSLLIQTARRTIHETIEKAH